MKVPNAIYLIATTFLLNTHAAMATDPGSITIEMLGLHSDQGQAIFVLMDSESAHRGKSQVFSKQIIPIIKKAAEVTFQNVPSGEYSAVIYHDVNGNGELDRYFFGLPKEPYGFSNGARNPIGIPGFNESKLVIKSSQSIQQITVK